MPSRAPRICPCGHTVPSGARCSCQKARDGERKAKHEAKRASARQRGYTVAWAKASKAFLARPENRLCACGCGRVADMVDHRIAHKGDPRLFWAESNWQAMASICNRRKAVREEGAFGRPTVDQGAQPRSTSEQGGGGLRNSRPAQDRSGESRSQLVDLKKGILSYGA